jgi:hypothetical protein
MSSRSKFDKDLKFGEAGENWLVWLGSQNAKVEVKTERDTWEKTGNVAFEFKYWGNPSGIAITQADWWVHILSKNNEFGQAFIFPVPRLKDFLRSAYHEPSKFNCRISTGGDDRASDMILVPINQLHEISKYKK